MKNISKVLFTLIVFGLALTSCTAKEEAKELEAVESDVLTVSLVCDKIGTNPFLTQMQDAMEEMQATYGLEISIIECADLSVWEENIRMSAISGSDMIIVAGWAGMDPIDTVANEFSGEDDPVFVLIDAEIDNQHVKSITFREQEGAYLVGMIAGLINPTNKFGQVYAEEGASNIKWEWGFQEGVKAVRENPVFFANYTNSYTDAAKAKEFALQQSAAGCGFIFAASAVADYGTFEAAQEKGFYTSGQDADKTTPDNPYIMTTQLKNTGNVIRKVVSEFAEGTMSMESEIYGIKEGTIGATYITDEGLNPRDTSIFTDEMVGQVKAVAESIRTGELELTPTGM
jgi:basic membrane protein A and related proteins